MASTVVSSSNTDLTPFQHGCNLVLAGTRLYSLYQNGTAFVYKYSDDDGGTWSAETTIASGSNFYGSAVYDSVNSHLRICYAGGNSYAQKLAYRAIKSNVASGTPGSLTTEAVIDAGGSNAGVQYPYIVHTATSTRPRIWIIAQKCTALDTLETRAWYCPVSTATDPETAGNWVTTNFTNLGSNSNANASKHGVGAWWSVSSAEKLTFVFGTGSTPLTYETVTFDPTAATPTPGTVTGSVFTVGNGLDEDIYGPPMTIAAKADYLVFGRYDAQFQSWTFYKTVNGTTWTSPTGWNNITMGKAVLTKSGSDFYILHTATYGVPTTSAQGLRYRLITTSSDTMGGASVFSDTDGSYISAPLNTGTSKLYGLYRAGTASPYPIRSDFLSIGGGGSDTTAPSAASVTATVLSSTSVFVSAVMPADVDVAAYQIRYLTGSTAPATDRSNGTVALAETATSANQNMNFTITGLTAGTQITGRVFVKDTSSNWNTGATFTATPASTPTFVNRYKADGTTVIADGTTPGGNNPKLVYQLATANFLSGGANAHFRLRVGTDDATPPTENTYELSSTSADGTFQTSSTLGGSKTTVPAAGLASASWGHYLWINTAFLQSSQYFSLRVEQ